MESENNDLNKLLARVSWFFVVICIAGSIANIYKCWWSFALWSVSNVYLIFHNYIKKEYSQTFLFAVYLVISIWGMVDWLLQ